MARERYRELLLFYSTEEISNKRFGTKTKKRKDKLGLLLIKKTRMFAKYGFQTRTLSAWKWT